MNFSAKENSSYEFLYFKIIYTKKRKNFNNQFQKKFLTITKNKSIRPNQFESNKNIIFDAAISPPPNPRTKFHFYKNHTEIKAHIPRPISRLRIRMNKLIAQFVAHIRGSFAINLVRVSRGIFFVVFSAHFATVFYVRRTWVVNIQ